MTLLGTPRNLFFFFLTVSFLIGREGEHDLGALDGSD